MKQQLTEALARGIGERTDVHWLTVHTAARLVERLLPGECEICETNGFYYPFDNEGKQPCPVCHGSGRVWDEGIVRVIQVALAPFIVAWELDEKAAHAVLSAIAQLAEAGSQ